MGQGRRKVAQTMYKHVNKCKNNKRKEKINQHLLKKLIKSKH
jgi:hypothetical protein